MAILADRLLRIKEDPQRIVDPLVVAQACRDNNHTYRKRTLDPFTTIGAMVAQIAAGNTAMTDLVGLMGNTFSPSAYCQARARLPLAVLKVVLDDFIKKLRERFDVARDGAAKGDHGVAKAADAATGDGRWRGLRIVLIDGTGVVMPDTPELRTHFGTAATYNEGCGLPLAAVLIVFDAHHGMLLDMTVSSAHAGELRHAPELHPAMQRGDVLVGDRGLCSYKHLFEVGSGGFHTIFRMGFGRKVDFPALPGPREKNGYNRHRAERATLVLRHSDDDQIVEIIKPHNRPRHVTAEEFAKIPAKQEVRTLRFRIDEPGVRSSEITVMTTLLDATQYPAAEIAELYRARWRIEQNMRHLKRTMNMERLKCETVEGVKRELMAFALVYNAVCACRVLAAQAQGVPPLRISFVDTLRWMLRTSGDVPKQVEVLGPLVVLPLRKPRSYPRARKRSDSPFPVMNWPRKELTKIALAGGAAA